MTGEPTSSGVLGALIMKIGVMKIIGMVIAVAGALLMAAARPPKTRKELYLHCLVALGVSLLFGGAAVQYADHYLDFVDMVTANQEDALQFYVAVHGALGAVSWGALGLLASLRDKLATGDYASLIEKGRE